MAKKYPGVKGRGVKSSTFSMLLHHVQDSGNYSKLPSRAVKLLVDILRFYNGRNNGDLAITMRLMKPLGWTSKDQLSKAMNELEHYGFLKKSRQGGRHLCSLYALTFFAVDDCGGKHDLTSSKIPTNDWRVDQPNKPVFRKSLPRASGDITPRDGLKRVGKVVELPRRKGLSGGK